MNTGLKTASRLGTALCIAFWLGACNAPLPEEAAPDSDLPATSASPDASIALDTTTQCKLGSQVADSFPDIPFDLPTPPAEVSWTEVSRDSNQGSGFIGPVEKAVNPDLPDYLLVGFATADWVKRVILPRYDAPNGQIESWMACGWLMLGPEAEQTEMELPLFFPGYSGFGMVVLAEDGDWLQLYDGAWVSRSHLESSTIPLAYQSWQERYQAILLEHNTIYATDDLANDPGADWGFFSTKDAATTLTLYPSPNTQAAPIAELDATASMLPLEIQGDWMRVRAYRPNNFCIEDWQGETDEGWVRWLDPAKGGNQIAEPYKGC